MFFIFFAKKNLKFRVETLPFDTHSAANLPPLGMSKKSIFLEKPIYFFKKDPNFERFEKFYYFCRFRRPICYNLVNK